MPIHLVELPGAVTLVPGKTLDGQLRRQASNPYVPEDLRALIGYLNGRTDGVPAALDEPRPGSTDKSMVLFGPSYVVRLFPTRHRDGYTIAGIYPLRAADHSRLADRYLRVRPPLWRSVHEPRQIPAGSDAYWPRIDAEWTRLLAAHSTAHGVPAAPTARSTVLLETLERLIDATERIDGEKTRAAPPFPYRDVSATGERRRGTRAVYRFHLAGGRTPQDGTFVQLRGGSERRGQVVRVVAEGGHEIATVRFDEPVAWGDLAPQGELEMTPTNVVYRKQREAVARLRTGQEANPALLPMLTERRVQPFRAAVTQPAEPLDPDQLSAYQKALTVPDLLIVLGPPGTGKTRTISEIVRSSAIAEPPERILVTSHTHRAVDNVLARLPRDLVIVRVGHENSVTAEGKPYLLDRQIADLRGEILGRTAHAPDACTDPENAAPWADELSLYVDELAVLTEQAARARTDLDGKRRAVRGRRATPRLRGPSGSPWHATRRRGTAGTSRFGSDNTTRSPRARVCRSLGASSRAEPAGCGLGWTRCSFGRRSSTRRSSTSGPNSTSPNAPPSPRPMPPRRCVPPRPCSRPPGRSGRPPTTALGSRPARRARRSARRRDWRRPTTQPTRTRAGAGSANCARG